MTVEIIDGVEHVYAPNPKLEGEKWSAEYPPIVTNSPWLISKYTGELFPNTPEFARRSDILEAYLGTPQDLENQTTQPVNEVLANAQSSDETLATL